MVAGANLLASHCQRESQMGQALLRSGQEESF